MASLCKRQQCTIDRRGFRQELDSWRHKLIHCVGFESILEGLFDPRLVEELKLFKGNERATVSDWSFDENCLFCCLRRDKVKEHLIGLTEGLEDSPKPLLVKDQITINRLEKQAEEFLSAVLSKKDVPNFPDPHIPVVAREILQRMIRQFAAEYTSKSSSPQDSCSESQPGSDQSRPTSPLPSGVSPPSSPAPTLAGPAHNQNPVLSKLLMADQDAPLDLTIKKPMAEPTEQDGVLDLSIKKNHSSTPSDHSPKSLQKGESTDIHASKAKDLQSTSTLEQFLAKLCPHHQRQIVDALGFLQTEVKAYASIKIQKDVNTASGVEGLPCFAAESTTITSKKIHLVPRFSNEFTTKSEVKDVSQSISNSCAIKKVPESAVSLKTSVTAGPDLDLCSPSSESGPALATFISNPLDVDNNHNSEHAPLKMKIMTSKAAAGKKLSCVLSGSLSESLDEREIGSKVSSRIATCGARLSSSVKRHSQTSQTYQDKQREAFEHAKDTPEKAIPIHTTILSDTVRTARKAIRPSTYNQTRESSNKVIVDPDLGNCDIVFIDKPITECFKKRHRGLTPRRNARKSTRGRMYSDEIWELKTVRTLAGKGNCPNPMPELITLVTPKQISSKPDAIPPLDMLFVGESRNTNNQEITVEELVEHVIPGTEDIVDIASSKVNVMVEHSPINQCQSKGVSDPSKLVYSSENTENIPKTDIEQGIVINARTITDTMENVEQTSFDTEKGNEIEPLIEVHVTEEQIAPATLVEPLEYICQEEADPQFLLQNSLIALMDKEEEERPEDERDEMQDVQHQEHQPEIQFDTNDSEIVIEKVNSAVSPSKVMTKDPAAEPEDPEAVSQEPGAVSQEPGAVSQEPGAVSQEPGAVSQEPGAVSQEPGAVSQEPGAVSQEPGAVSEDPGAVSQEPGAVSQEPGAVSQEPGAVSEEPGAVSEEPGAVSPEPGAVSPEPGAVSPEPGAVSPEPGAVSEEPGAVSEKPGAVSEKPGAVSEKPGAVSEKPGAVSEKPGAVSPEPGAESQEPGAVSPEPGAESPEPGAESEEPGAVLPEPGAVSEEPGAVSEKPGAVSEKPGAVSEKPGAVSEKPGAVSPEPGAESQEPGAVSEEPGAVSPEPGAESPEPGAESEEPGAVLPEPGAESQEPPANLPETVDSAVLSEAEEFDDNECDVSSKTLDALLKELPPWRRKRGSKIVLPKRLLKQKETIIVGYFNGRPISASDRHLRRRSVNTTSLCKIPEKLSPVKDKLHSKDKKNEESQSHMCIKDNEVATVIEQTKSLEQVQVPSSDAESNQLTKSPKTTRLQKLERKKVQKAQVAIPDISNQPNNNLHNTEPRRKLRSAEQKPSESLKLTSDGLSSTEPSSSSILPSEQLPPLTLTHPPSNLLSPPTTPLQTAGSKISEHHAVSDTMKVKIETTQLTISEEQLNNEVDSPLKTKPKLRSRKADANDKKNMNCPISEISNQLKTSESQTQIPLRNKRMSRNAVEASEVVSQPNLNVAPLEKMSASVDIEGSAITDGPTKMPLRSGNAKPEIANESVTQSPQQKVALRSQKHSTPSPNTNSVITVVSDVALITSAPGVGTKGKLKPSPASLPHLSTIVPKCEPVKSSKTKFLQTLNSETSQHLISNLNIRYDKMQKGWLQMDKEAQPTTKYKNKADRQAAIWKSKRRIRKSKSEQQKHSPVQMLFMKGFDLSSICRWFLESSETKSLVIVKKVNTRLPSETQLCFHSSSASGTSQGVFPSLQAERLKKHLKKFAIASPVKSNPKSQKLIAKTLEQDAISVKGKESELPSEAQTLKKSPSCAKACAEISEPQKSTGKSKNPASARILRKYSNIREKMQVQQTTARLKGSSKIIKGSTMKKLVPVKAAVGSNLKPSKEAPKTDIPGSKESTTFAAKINKRESFAKKETVEHTAPVKAVKTQGSSKTKKDLNKKEKPTRNSQRLFSPKTSDNRVSLKSKVNNKKHTEVEIKDVDRLKAKKAYSQKTKTFKSSNAEVKASESTSEEDEVACSPDQVLTRSQRKMEAAVPPSPNTINPLEKTAMSAPTPIVSPKSAKKCHNSASTRSANTMSAPTPIASQKSTKKAHHSASKRSANTMSAPTPITSKKYAKKAHNSASERSLDTMSAPTPIKSTKWAKKAHNLASKSSLTPIVSPKYGKKTQNSASKTRVDSTSSLTPIVSPKYGKKTQNLASKTRVDSTSSLTPIVSPKYGKKTQNLASKTRVDSTSSLTPIVSPKYGKKTQNSASKTRVDSTSSLTPIVSPKYGKKTHNLASKTRVDSMSAPTPILSPKWARKAHNLASKTRVNSMSAPTPIASPKYAKKAHNSVSKTSVVPMSTPTPIVSPKWAKKACNLALKRNADSTSSSKSIVSPKYAKKASASRTNEDSKSAPTPIASPKYVKKAHNSASRTNVDSKSAPTPIVSKKYVKKAHNSASTRSVDSTSAQTPIRSPKYGKKAHNSASKTSVDSISAPTPIASPKSAKKAPNSTSKRSADSKSAPKRVKAASSPRTALKRALKLLETPAKRTRTSVTK